MKKVFLLLAISIVILSCQNRNNSVQERQMTVENQDSTVKDGEENELVSYPDIDRKEIYGTFKATLPAADGPGIMYILSIFKDDESKASLKIEYLGNKADKPLIIDGKTNFFFAKEKAYLRIVSKEDSETYNFLIIDANTLRLVSTELQEAQNKPESYDLKKID